MTETQDCIICKQEKPIDFFIPDKRHKNGRSRRCRKCANERAKQWKKDNHDVWFQVAQKTRRKALLKKFNLTIMDYEQQLALQDYACAVCNKPQEQEQKRLCVDYDEVGKRLRGLLCFRCKRTVTMWEKYPNNLIENPNNPAAKYILNPPQWEAGD